VEKHENLIQNEEIKQNIPEIPIKEQIISQKQQEISENNDSKPIISESVPSDNHQNEPVLISSTSNPVSNSQSEKIKEPEKESTFTISQATIINLPSKSVSKPIENLKEQPQKNPRLKQKSMQIAQNTSDDKNAIKIPASQPVNTEIPMSQQSSKAAQVLSGFSKLEVVEEKSKKSQDDIKIILKEEKLESIKPTKLKFTENKNAKSQKDASQKEEIKKPHGAQKIVKSRKEIKKISDKKAEPRKPQEEKAQKSVNIKKEPENEEQKIIKISENEPKESEKNENNGIKRKAPPIKLEKRRKLIEEAVSKEFEQQCTIKLETEELTITADQKQIIDLFQVTYKKSKGNRSLILDRELSLLKNIPMKYKEVPLSNNINSDDLDVCTHLGEKVYKKDNNIIWKQVDIIAMKAERKSMAALKKEKKISVNSGIICSIEGQEKKIGEKNITRRPAFSAMDDGKVKLIYHGEDGPLSIFVVDILKDGEFVHQLTGEKIVFLIYVSKN